MAHSATPWTTYKDGDELFIVAGDRFVARTVDYGHGCSSADAEYIVRCVNAHESLVAALKEMTEACKAAMRVIANIDGGDLTERDVNTMERRFSDEVKRAGVTNGFGIRAQQALKLAEPHA